MSPAEREAIREHNRPPHGKADRTITALLDEVERLETQLAERLENPRICRLWPQEDKRCGSCEPCQLTQRIEGLETEVERMRKALGLVMWMAERYAEAGGPNGPEMREWREAKALADGPCVAKDAPNSIERPKDGP